MVTAAGELDASHNSVGAVMLYRVQAAGLAVRKLS